MKKVFLYTLEMTMREWKRTSQFEMPIIWIIVGFNPQDMRQTCRHKFPSKVFVFEETNDAAFFCSTHVLFPIRTDKGDQVLFRIVHFHNSKKLVIVIFRQSTKPKSILNTEHRNRGVDMLVSKYFPTIIVCNYWSQPWILWDVFIQFRIANLLCVTTKYDFDLSQSLNVFCWEKWFVQHLIAYQLQETIQLRSCQLRSLDNAYSCVVRCFNFTQQSLTMTNCQSKSCEGT